MKIGIGALLYLAIGVILAALYDYFDELSALDSVLSALVAIALWPLLLLGVNFDINFQ